MDNYLGSLKGSKVKSLQELVEWNSAHVEEALTAGMSARRNYSFSLIPLYNIRTKTNSRLLSTLETRSRLAKGHLPILMLL